MDKNWMTKSRLSKEYSDGVDAFFRFAIENGKDPTSMYCPCVKCHNLKKNKVEIIRAHLTYNGMDLTYTKWIFHGEGCTSQSTSVRGQMNTEQSCSYTDDAVVDMVHDAYVDNPNHLQKLLEDAEMPLYSGCANFTKLSATVKLLNLKVKYAWSDASFTELLKLIKELLPADNILPPTLYEARKGLSTLGMKYEKIHAYPADCILYRNEYTNLENYPTCGKSR